MTNFVKKVKDKKVLHKSCDTGDNKILSKTKYNYHDITAWKMKHYEGTIQT